MSGRQGRTWRQQFFVIFQSFLTSSSFNFFCQLRTHMAPALIHNFSFIIHLVIIQYLFSAKDTHGTSKCQFVLRPSFFVGLLVWFWRVMFDRTTTMTGHDMLPLCSCLNLEGNFRPNDEYDKSWHIAAFLDLGGKTGLICCSMAIFALQTALMEASSNFIFCRFCTPSLQSLLVLDYHVTGSRQGRCVKCFMTCMQRVMILGASTETSRKANHTRILEDRWVPRLSILFGSNIQNREIWESWNIKNTKMVLKNRELWLDRNIRKYATIRRPFDGVL